MTDMVTRRTESVVQIVHIVLFAAILLACPSFVAAQENTAEGTAVTPSTETGNPALSTQVGRILTLTGEVGFRKEYMANERFAENDSTATDNYRYRQRVRLRFGGEVKPSEWFTAGFRFSTGASNYPASGWSSFSDDFRRDPVALDRIYINLNYKQFQLRMGGNANPLFRPTELVWDHDVQPGGFAEVYTTGNWEFVAGQFMLAEVRSLNSSEESGSFLFAHNVNYAVPVAGTLRLGVFQYLYNKPDALAIAIDDGDLDGDFKTNRLQPRNGRRYFSDYNSLGVSLLWASGVWQVAGEAVINVGAKNDASLGEAYAEKEDLGFGVLVRYGVLSEPGDWSVEAGFFHIEADATIAVFNSDDYQQTNVNSVPVFLRVRLPGGTTLVWDTYFQKRINTALYLSGGVRHGENALKIRSRLTLQLGF